MGSQGEIWGKLQPFSDGWVANQREKFGLNVKRSHGLGASPFRLLPMSLIFMWTEDLLVADMNVRSPPLPRKSPKSPLKRGPTNQVPC